MKLKRLRVCSAVLADICGSATATKNTLTKPWVKRWAYIYDFRVTQYLWISFVLSQKCKINSLAHALSSSLNRNYINIIIKRKRRVIWNIYRAHIAVDLWRRTTNDINIGEWSHSTWRWTFSWNVLASISSRRGYPGPVYKDRGIEPVNIYMSGRFGLATNQMSFC